MLLIGLIFAVLLVSELGWFGTLLKQHGEHELAEMITVWQIAIISTYFLFGTPIFIVGGLIGRTMALLEGIKRGVETKKE